MLWVKRTAEGLALSDISQWEDIPSTGGPSPTLRWALTGVVTSW